MCQVFQLVYNRFFLHLSINERIWQFDRLKITEWVHLIYIAIKSSEVGLDTFHIY